MLNEASDELVNGKFVDRQKRAGSVSSGKSKKSKRNAKKKRARRWTCLVESLKTSTDYLYEFCHNEKSVEGCKDAIMYLTNSVRDFEALIKSIEVENDFENLKEKTGRPNVAWEIRKTMGSPSHVLMDRLVQPNGPPFILINEKKQEMAQKEAQIGYEDNDENGWKVVQRRKRSVSSVTTQSLVDEKEMTPEEVESIIPPKQSVYDRLYSSAVKSRDGQPSTSNVFTSSRGGATSGRLMCPRSVMDLPQTRASMAKIAYSRQKLWQQRAQTTLAEKFKERQKLYRKEVQEKRAQTRCGLNFADPVAVKKAAQDFIEKKRKIREAASAIDLRSLGSICETGEEADAIPADPKPSDQQNMDLERIRPLRVPLPPASWHGVPLDLEDSVEWREMTEEEESLANEERSLTRELENEESISIDEEIERHVAADEDEIEENQESVQETGTQTVEPQTFAECLKNWDAKMYASFPWCEVFDDDFTGHYKEPGEETAKLEKLSSPRKRDISNLQEKTLLRQQRAEELRQQLLEEKAQRLKDLSKKIDEIRTRQAEIYERKMDLYATSMESHEEKRNKNIAEIVKKAKDDDQRVQEVIFCNTVEADLSAHEKEIREKVKEKEFEKRKDRIANERQKRHGEKVAKEQAAEERRKVAEQERVARLQELAEAKQARSSLVEAQREELEKGRRERRRQREERFELTKAAEIEKKSNEQKKKQIKFDSSIRRHEQTIETVRAKAHELANAKVFARWEALTNASAWPSQSTSKQWLCIRCNITLHSELEIMAHIIGQTHLDAWKTKALDVTHHKLAMEFCESVFEGDSTQTSLSTSIVIEEALDKKKIQKARQKITQRVKKCYEQVKESTPYKEQLKIKVKDRSIRDLQASLNNERQQRPMEHAIIDLIKQFNADDQLPGQLFASGLLRAIAEHIPSLAATIDQERIRAKLFQLLTLMCDKHPMASLYLFTCTNLPIWFADQMSALAKSVNVEKLLELLELWEGFIPKSVKLDKSYEIDQREIAIRVDMFVGYCLTLNVPADLDSLITKLMLSCENLSLVERLYKFAQKLNDVSMSESTIEFINKLIDPLLIGIIEQMQLAGSAMETSTASSIEESNTVIPQLHDNPYCLIALAFCSRLKEVDFKKSFCNNDSRFMRLGLILSKCIHFTSDQNPLRNSDFYAQLPVYKGLPSAKMASIVLVGRLTVLSPSHQLLFQLGGSSSTLATLCQLPIQYYTKKPSRELIVMAIALIARNSVSGIDLIKQHLGIEWISKSLELSTSQPRFQSYSFSKDDLSSMIQFFNSNL
ncbi:unnamed protein product, partial [Mesorhabditis belari]|uniref:S phase cyclin A-associated protein in the endoplasmic reticulum N-terminal domain-containing protein n=1 Tax=Mesorhabditis belari TaxID=2138241 RepID=A0AAF3EGB6_9BILA